MTATQYRNYLAKRILETNPYIVSEGGSIVNMTDIRPPGVVAAMRIDDPEHGEFHVVITKLDG